MWKKQSGFTLVEIAIVLIIIGLLLGGVLKGQELIGNAKVKNLANDFRSIPVSIYAYQDKFKAIPGDDASVDVRLPNATRATPASTLGNGVINGEWNSTGRTDESYLFWQHIRLAGLASGATATGDAAYLPTNAENGRIGIEAGSAGLIGESANGVAPALRGAYIVCSANIPGKLAKQLDVTLDDGVTNSGSLRVVTPGHTRGQAAVATNDVIDEQPYTVCMAS